MAQLLQLKARNLGIALDITTDLDKYKKFNPAVMFDQDLQVAFKELGYKHTFELMQHNIEGTLLMLHALDVLSFSSFSRVIACENNGENGAKVWSDYKEVILQHLKEIQPKEQYEKPRQKLSEIIYDKYYQKYPYWPDVGDFNYAAVPCSCNGGYVYRDNLIAWSVEGSLAVMDLHPTEDEYECKVSGEPTFKVIYTDLEKLKQHEAMMDDESNYLQYMGYVTDLQKKHKQLTFKNKKDLSVFFKRVMAD